MRGFVFLIAYKEVGENGQGGAGGEYWRYRR